VDLFLRNIEVIASATIFFAFILYISTRFNSSKNDISLITYKQSFVIGLAQCLALIPGTSRSGITISAGLMLGMDNKTASKFSFLLAVPTIGAIACYQFLSLDLSSFLATFKQNLIGALISFIVAYFTIDFFIKFIDRIGFIPFIIYRIILGLGLFFLIL
jgi:undecaprenyl-diphosphatase